MVWLTVKCEGLCLNHFCHRTEYPVSYSVTNIIHVFRQDLSYLIINLNIKGTGRFSTILYKGDTL